jgi:hypothetical protein
VKFLHRGSDTADLTRAQAEEAGAEAPEESQVPKSYTPGKGRPTPKRRESDPRSRGPVPPPPKTQREAYKRSRGDKSSKEERRKASATRRERMAAGDDRYLMPRDKGPVRAHVRDVVDSRRHLLGLFMPMAILIFIVLFVRAPALQQYVTSAVLVVLIIMLVEGIFLGRRVVSQVRQKFPNAEDRALSLGWYAGVRASQIRKLRMPKPRVKVGQNV